MAEERRSTITKPAYPAVAWYEDVLARLRERHEFHSKAIVAEMNSQEPNFGVIHQHEPMSQLFWDAIVAIEKTYEQNGYMTEALKNRISVALKEAKTPAWVPTHRHYKGTLYRVTGERFNADHEELEPMIEYDDEDGKKFVITKRRWESNLESGRPRYEYIYEKE